MEKLALMGSILMLSMKLSPARFLAGSLPCMIAGQSPKVFFMAKSLSKHLRGLEKNSKWFNSRTGGNMSKR